MAILFATNLHLPLLQVVAWAGMVIRYSADTTVNEAVKMTFDGEHPCPLCCAIRKAQEEPRQELNAPASSDRIDLIAHSAASWNHISIVHSGFKLPGAHGTPLRQPPPVPPPRAAA
jgi:hypothetical protein